MTQFVLVIATIVGFGGGVPAPAATDAQTALRVYATEDACRAAAAALPVVEGHYAVCLPVEAPALAAAF